MSKFRISISDRNTRRTIEAHDATEAVRRAVGQRLITCRQNAAAMDGSCAEYDVAVQTGPTRSGATPFRNIRAYVERL